MKNRLQKPGLLLVLFSLGDISVPNAAAAQANVPVSDQGTAAQIAEAEKRCHALIPTLKRETGRDSARLALNAFASCPDAGPPALAARWRSSPSDSVRLADLVFSSTRILDERVLEAAIRVTGDRSQPRDNRYAAISVIWYYVLQKRPVFGTALLNLPHPRVIIGVGGHNLTPKNGKQPLMGDVRQRSLVRLRQLAENAADDPHVLMAIRETIEEFGIIRR